MDAIVSRDTSAFGGLSIPKFEPQELIAHLVYQEIDF